MQPVDERLIHAQKENHLVLYASRVDAGRGSCAVSGLRHLCKESSPRWNLPHHAPKDGGEETAVVGLDRAAIRIQGAVLCLSRSELRCALRVKVSQEEEDEAKRPHEPQLPRGGDTGVALRRAVTGST